MNQFYDEVVNLRNTYCKTYQINKTQFLAAYNREKRISEDYNGRQILELLQNADDAHASKVKIQLIKSTNTIKISNTGKNENSFSSAGIESLMVADYSSKSKWENIGNKGLGFRSLLSWCDCIKIKSNGYCISFSEKIAHDFLLSKSDADDILDQGLGYTQEEIDAINIEEEYEEGTVCFPILGIPKIEKQNEFICIQDKSKVHWITEIELKYKDNQDILSAIEFQLSENGLNDNVLLFLNHITEIEIEVDSNTVRKITSKILKKEEEFYGSYYLKEINGICWKILSDLGEYPKEAFGNIKKLQKIPKYSAMIAWKDTHIEDNYLYTYFPTLITLKLPFIIHGSFKIDSARNHLIQENTSFKNNEFIFDKVILLIKIAVIRIQNQDIISNWSSYEFLQTNGLPHETVYFNNKLQELQNTLKIYPSVKDEYLSYNEYKYYSERWSDFALKEEYKDIFSEMIKSGRVLETKESNLDFYEPTILKQKLETVIELIKNKDKLEERLELISILKDFNLSKKFENWNNGEKFELLYSGINEDNTVVPIKNTETAFVYTEDSYNEVDKYKPDYAQFSLVDNELNNRLFKSLEVEEERRNSQNPDESLQRTLARLLSSFIKVKEYDITAITKDVISQTKQEIDNNPQQRETIIQQEIRFLYFANNSWRKETRKPEYKAYFLNKNHDVKLATDLYFSSTYSELGETVEKLFSGINTDDDFLAQRNVWTVLKDEEINNIIKFFSYFGVNSFITVESLKALELKDFQSRDKISDFNKITGSNGNYYDSIDVIQNIDKIQQITDLTTLLLIIYKSDILRQKLLYQNYEIYRSSAYTQTKYSFACWQLRKLKKFDNSFAHDKNSVIFKILNQDNPIRLETFSEYDIPLTDIEKIMVSLNAKNQLKDFGEEKIYKIICSLKDIISDGKYVKSVYSEAKSALVELEKEKHSITPPNEVEYFSKKGNLKFYEINTKVYYFNDKILPRKVMNSISILDMPLRQGGDVIPRLFNIKGKDDFNIQIIKIVDSNYNYKFQDKLNELKPYLFALRFKTNVKDKESEIKALNDSNIILVKELQYKCPSLGPDLLNLDDYDFVTGLTDDNYYIKVPEEDNFFTMPQFQDSLTEILSIIFNLTDESKLNDFRLVISRMNVLSSLTENGFLLDEEIDESNKYCNLKYTQVYKLWDSIYSLYHKGWLPEQNWKSINEVIDYVVADLHINKPSFDIRDFNSKEGICYLKMLQDTLGISPIQLLKDNRLTLQNYNVKSLKDIQSKYEKQFIKKWWDECNLTKDIQKDYFERIFKYRDLLDTVLQSNESELLDDLKYNIDLNLQDYFEKILLRYTKGEKWNQIKIDFINNNYKEIKELDEYKEILYLKNNKNKYLFYFSGNMEIIKKECSEDTSDSSSTPPQLGQIKAEWGTGKTPEDDNKKPKQKHHGSFNESDQGKTKKTGTAAENIVIKYFNDNHFSYIDRRGESGESNSDDSYHYDFEYWKDNEPHRYLEVKHDGDVFMSVDEKEFGLNFENKSYYDMALVDVQNQSINFIKSFFDFEEDTETFENNKNFKATPVKYKIETVFKKD